MRWLAVVCWLAMAAAPAPVPVPPVAPATPEALAARIDAALASDAPEVARDLITRAEGQLPAPRLALARADFLLATGEPDGAATAYAGLIGDAGVGARAQLGLGLARLRQDRTAEAAAAFDAATARDPALLRAWVGRGVAADRLRDWAGADAAYGHALALDPRSAAALTNRGYSRLLRGDSAGATTDLTQALVIDSKSEVARTDLRLARAMAGDYKGAFAGATKVTMAHDLNTVGFAAMARGDYAVAESYFARAMQLSPEFDHAAWANLVYLKQLAHKPADPGAPER